MNAFELYHRERKLSLLLAAMPPVESEKHAIEQSAVVASWNQMQRDAFAHHAGCKSPSPITWAEFVQRVRARRPVNVEEVQTRRSA